MEIVSSNNAPRSLDKLGAKNLYALQKLGEILHWKKTQVAALESEICSSPTNLSISKHLKSPASSSKHKSGDGLRFVNEIGKDFRSTDTLKEQKTEMHRLMNGKNLLIESRASSSNELMEILSTNSSRVKARSNSCKGKQVSEASEVEQLSRRLKVLEEENETMKQEFLQHMEEREKVVAEIFQQFQTIHDFLKFENQVHEERSPRDGSSIVKFLKKAGLELAGQKFSSESQVHALSEADTERRCWLFLEKSYNSDIGANKSPPP
ncbi:unnamed protein product [Dovyalis caffra]|uniref:Uncharacterized protein n=1 Tax=Dovyalis caffra TaxID=77055 RepID=A0AAV1STW8_9ROSI|nr:unnamed protein product [Dovyalis caffra]